MFVSQIYLTNFQGNFYNNSLLQSALAEANNYELKRFSDLLCRMKKFKDNNNYTLETRYNHCVKTKDLYFKRQVE